MTASAPALPERDLRPGICLACWACAGFLACVVGASFAWLPLDLGRLFTAESGRYMVEFVGRFFPPDLSAAFLQKIFRGTIETLAISAVGTLIAVVGGLALSLPAAGRLGRPPKMCFRVLLSFLRSVPELVWAVLMVLAVGLGPFAGTLALALHTSGVLGRLYADTLENVSPQASDALMESGATTALAFAYGSLPMILPQVVAYALYRWEMNIRMATVLGFVGAGGLGQLLYYELSLLHERQACTVIVAMLLLVILVDAGSAWVRRRQMPSAA